MVLNGPSYVTLAQLATHQNMNSALTNLSAGGIQWYEPRGARTDTGVVTVYHGDDLYTAAELTAANLSNEDAIKHRLFMHKDLPWQFEDTRQG